MTEAQGGRTPPAAFEDTVGELLQMAGYHVTPEQLLGHKKVDLLATEYRFGKLRRIAVECKLYQRKISQKELSEIYASYHPVLQANLADEILLVTDAGLTPSAVTMVTETHELSHLSLAELQDLVMDFHQYLQEMVHQFGEDGLLQYYIPAWTVNSRRSLEEVMLEWIAAQDSTPRAILGSYGMGKTSFARRLVNLLASRAIKDPSARIPVFIKLGSIAAEQSLEGLLGRVLTATSLVRGYSFSAFMRLNQLGRFVIILDGFDEMKHTLSWDEFTFNFRQINRLVVPLSKVVILGRPTAFLSDAEQRHALKGIRLYAGQEVREPDWPEYQQLDLAPFSGQDIRDFLQMYIKYKYSQAPDTKENARLFTMLDEQITNMSAKAIYDIASRPVQLRMLAEVLPQWKGSIDDITVTILYSMFIDLIIEREAAKATRRKFDTRQRRDFARRIAWWLWTTRSGNGSQTGVNASDLPDEILDPFLRPGSDPQGILRDLISACFLDRKSGDSLFFPHRSFQEFLVAESMLERLNSSIISLEEAQKYCTPEVGSFLASLVGKKDLLAWDQHLKTYRGQLATHLAEAWVSFEDALDFLYKRTKESNSPWYLAFLTLAATRQPDRHSRIIDRMLDVQDASEDIAHCFLCHLCAMFCLSGMGRNNNADVGAARAVERSLTNICRVGLGGSWQRMISKGRRSETRESYLLRLIGSGMTVHEVNPHVVQFISKVVIGRSKGTIDIGGTYRELLPVLSEYCLLSGWVWGTTLGSDAGANLSTVVSLSSCVSLFAERFCQ